MVSGAESGGNPNAKNPETSAYGKFQFVEDTWIRTFKLAFPKSNLSNSQILALRSNPEVQQILQDTLTASNGQVLDRAGMPVNDVTLRLMHLLGAKNALKTLRASADTPMEKIVSADVLEKNASLLKGRTVGDLVEWAAQQMGAKEGGPAPPGTPQMSARRIAASTPEPAPMRQVSDFYRGNPEAIGNDMRVLMTTRAELVRKAQIALAAGIGEEAEAYRDQVVALDQNILQVQASQAMMDLSYSADPRRMAAVWSYQTGQDINIRPYTDGTFDVLSGGGVVHSRVSMDELTDMFMSATDSGFRQRKIDFQFKAAEEQLKMNAATQQEALKQAGQMRLDSNNNLAKLNQTIAEQMLRGRNDIALETARQNGLKTQLVNRADGSSSVVIYTPNGDVMQVLDLNAPGMEIDGVKMPAGIRVSNVPGLMRQIR